MYIYIMWKKCIFRDYVYFPPSYFSFPTIQIKIALFAPIYLTYAKRASGKKCIKKHNMKTYHRSSIYSLSQRLKKGQKNYNFSFAFKKDLEVNTTTSPDKNTLRKKTRRLLLTCSIPPYFDMC